MTPLACYLLLSALLFAIGLAGALTRRNAIIVLIGIELMLNAANLNFIAFWRYGPQPGGAHRRDVRDLLDWRRRGGSGRRAGADHLDLPALPDDQPGPGRFDEGLRWIWIVQQLWLIPALPLLAAGLSALLKQRQRAARGVAGDWLDGPRAGSVLRWRLSTRCGMPATARPPGRSSTSSGSSSAIRR